MSVVLEMLQYPFMVRALVVGVLISICASLLGTSLVLKRYSMIGDSLSHVGFAALAVAYAFYLDPLVISIPVTMAAAFLLLELKESMRIKGDAATALLCSSALAVGVLVISLTRGMNTDVCNYMFGSILAMSSADVWLTLAAGSLIILLYILFYHPLFAVTFDESFATASGVRSHFYHLVLALMTAVTIVLGMRMMGALLISSLIVFPAITAMQICHRYLTTIEASTLVGLGCFLVGITLSYALSIPTGPCIVLMNLMRLSVCENGEKEGAALETMGFLSAAGHASRTGRLRQRAGTGQYDTHAQNGTGGARQSTSGSTACTRGAVGLIQRHGEGQLWKYHLPLF